MRSVLRTVVFALALTGTTMAVKAQCATNFSYTIGSGGIVTFTASASWSTSTTNYYWSFGNNTYSSGINMQVTSASYTTNQVYLVSLYATDSLNSGCSAWSTQTIAITGPGCNASLSVNESAGPNGLVNFQALLNGQTFQASSASWAFGDGGTQNGGVFASHTYSVSGLYTVSVSVATGICTYTASKTISVTVAPCNLNASFTYTLGANGSATFASTSTGAGTNAGYYWYFGDGNYGYGQTVSHNYNSNQQYSVILTVNDSTSFFCNDSTLQTITVTTGPCGNNSSFWVAKDSTQALTWNAYPSFPANVVSVLWSWGDGGTSNSFYPSHTYSAAGFYTICVSTTLSCGTSTTFCWAGNVYRPSSGEGLSSVVTINVINPNSPVGLQQKKDDLRIVLYPNPASEMVAVLWGVPNENAGLEIIITDLTGKKIRQQHLVAVPEQGSVEIDTADLPEGLYYLQLRSGSVQKARKLIIRR